MRKGILVDNPYTAETLGLAVVWQVSVSKGTRRVTHDGDKVDIDVYRIYETLDSPMLANSLLIDKLKNHIGFFDEVMSRRVAVVKTDSPSFEISSGYIRREPEGAAMLKSGWDELLVSVYGESILAFLICYQPRMLDSSIWEYATQYSL